MNNILLSIPTAGGAAPTVPGAPTGVSATAGNAQATVSFTAPGNGGSAITGYTVTGTPSGSATGASSPIVVTGLTNGTAYTFTVRATNAIGTGTASAASNSVTPSSGTAPTLVQVMLQGMQLPDTGQSGAVPYPNNVTIGWKSVSGATSYDIYRRTTSGSGGSYTLLTTVTSSSATSAYSTYVTNQASNGGWPIQTACDSAFVDTAATTIVGATEGPNGSGVYYANNPYTYKVAVGGSGTLSADSVIIFFAGGKQITCKGIFNGQMNFSDTTAPIASPLGYTTNALFTAQFGTNLNIVNPYSGGNCCDGNLGINGYNYLVMNVLCNAAANGSNFTMSPEIEGDRGLLTTALNSTSYGTFSSTQWVTLKVPLSQIYIDQAGGTNAQQYCFYKITLSSAVPSGQTWLYWMEWYLSVN